MVFDLHPDSLRLVSCCPPGYRTRSLGIARSPSHVDNSRLECLCAQITHIQRLLGTAMPVAAPVRVRWIPRPHVDRVRTDQMPERLLGISNGLHLEYLSGLPRKPGHVVGERQLGE